MYLASLLKHGTNVAVSIVMVSLGVASSCVAHPSVSSANRIEVSEKAPGSDTSEQSSWRELEETVHTPSRDIRYFSFKLDNGSQAHLVVVDLKSGRARLRPYANNPNCPPSSTAAFAGALAAVNGGYFNLSNGQSASYVVVDGKVVCDPHGNPALMTNQKLQPYISKVLNRSELRCLVDRHGKPAWEICPHQAPVPPGMVLRDSLQAGPQLLPELTDREEAFVRRDPDGKEIDSIGSYKPAARTAVGLTEDEHALILCVAGSKQDEFSSGAKLSEVAALLKRLGCNRAMNFDGGTSTTMVVMLADADGRYEPKVVCGRHPDTMVNSVLVVEPTGGDRSR
jgi:ribosomal protein S16